MDKCWQEIRALALRWMDRGAYDYGEFDLIRAQEQLLIAQVRIAGINLDLDWDDEENVYRIKVEVR